VVELAALASRFVLAAVFLGAGLAKLARPAEFAGAVDAYRLVPAALVRPLATWLPRLEVAAGALLAVGAASRPAALAALVLLLSFAAAIAANLLRGRTIDCGCLGTAAPRRIGWPMVGRNLALAGMALLVAGAAPRVLAVPAPLGDGRPSGLDAGRGAAVALATLGAAGAAALAAEAARLGRRRRAFLRALAGGGLR
jgi:uncharacterized membrane protein YphA (DoxX/SURF4 family)